MSGHPEERELVEFEGLEAHRRAELLAHVRECTECRGRWAAGDPSRLFAALALAPVDAAALDGLSAAVGRSIRPRRRLLHAAASMAASLLLAALIGSLLWDGDLAPSEAPAVAVVTPAEEADWSGVELVDSPGEAQVVRLTVGETRVVMIFDEALDL